MDVLGLRYALFIGPLELFFEVVYAVAFRLVENPGVAIVFLSLAMNFLVLPLYRRADAMQEAERERSMRMKPGTDHIKKTFKGDERFMMLQTYNRQNGYKPTDALKGSVSLLLEIPFFIAAYHFLSNLALLRGVPFGPIHDLGAPDALLQVAGISINVLPILMTAINLISAFIYMKGLPLANKIQMYGIAAIFLVLLYNSPSGLVFYWTLNNVFSLVKNVFYRMKNPQRVLRALASVVGLALLVLAVVHPMESIAREAFVVAAGLALQVPLVLQLVRSRRRKSDSESPKESKRLLHLPKVQPATRTEGRVFLFSGLFLALLTGALIPAAVIQASPSEFVNLLVYESPLWYIAYTTCIALGTFVVWFGVFYWLASPSGKTMFACGMFAACGVAVVDYLFFGTDLGNMSAVLMFDQPPTYGLGTIALNLVAIVVVAVVLVLLWNRKRRIAGVACACMCVAAFTMSAVSVFGINSSLDSSVRVAEAYQKSGEPSAKLSRDGKNVVVIMLDRAISYYLPYIMQENPRIAESLQGFTFYPNAVSYGAATNFGTPALYGGYDYTPERMNERSDTSLASKQDEALKVMPRLFSQAGFDTTFYDPTYAGYSFTPDLSAFDDLPDVTTNITMSGKYTAEEFFDPSLYEPSDPSVSHDTGGVMPPPRTGLSPFTLRSFFCYSLFKVAPVAVQPMLYNNGDYNSTSRLTVGDQITPDWYTFQTRENASVSRGVDDSFALSYGVLQKLPKLAEVVDGNQNTCLLMSNDTPHEPCVLEEPSYRPALRVDNTAYDEAHRTRTAADGSTIEFPAEDGGREASPIMHYQANMAMMRELCNWFDYLREQGAYDNTRIILVSDHGRNLRENPALLQTVSDGKTGEPLEIDPLMMSCLLMEKDFDSQEFNVDESFMTNADTPALAMDGLIDNPVNPNTGNAITTTTKDSGPQNVFYSLDWNIATNNGNTFLPGYWLSVSGDIQDPANWSYLGYY